jgi:hypothetical protein
LQAQFLRACYLVRNGCGTVDAAYSRLRLWTLRRAGRKVVQTHVF